MIKRFFLRIFSFIFKSRYKWWWFGRINPWLFAAFAAAVLTGVVLLLWRTTPYYTSAGTVPEVIAQSIDSNFTSCLGTPLYAATQVKAFYKSRDGKVAWVNQHDNMQMLAGYLGDAEANGLFTRDYHQGQINKWMPSLQRWAQAGQTDSLAALDMLMTDACLAYAADISTGILYSDSLNVNRRENLAAMHIDSNLNVALQQHKLNDWLRQLPPDNCKYFELKQALAMYRKIAAQGGFVKVGEPALQLRPGDTGWRVVQLRKYLEQTGDLPYSKAGTSRLFKSDLASGICHFQQCHGLRETGLVDMPTYKAIHVPVEYRIIQILASMERLRWLPTNLGQKYIQVNIADYTLEIMDNYCAQLKMRVIVGKPYKQTPVFSSNLKYIVLNPSWEVPWSIMTEEMLPRLQNDAGYLARNHMVVADNKGNDINPDTINWSLVDADHFNFRIRQTPGPWNALGIIKFYFPNPYSVYLHGTPDKTLFDRDVRTLSHGCMRVEDPLAMAAYLLKDKKGWDKARIKRSIAEGDEKAIVLPHSIPVIVTYLTATTNDNDELCFSDDIYGRDTLFARYFKAQSIAMTSYRETF